MRAPAAAVPAAAAPSSARSCAFPAQVGDRAGHGGHGRLDPVPRLADPETLGRGRGRGLGLGRRWSLRRGPGVDGGEQALGELVVVGHLAEPGRVRVRQRVRQGLAADRRQRGAARRVGRGERGYCPEAVDGAGERLPGEGQQELVRGGLDVPGRFRQDLRHGLFPGPERLVRPRGQEREVPGEAGGAATPEYGFGIVTLLGSGATPRRAVPRK